MISVCFGFFFFREEISPPAKHVLDTRAPRGRQRSKNLLRHHLAAAGPTLGLLLGLFLKTLIISPLFPSQLTD